MGSALAANGENTGSHRVCLEGGGLPEAGRGGGSALNQVRGTRLGLAGGR